MQSGPSSLSFPSPALPVSGIVGISQPSSEAPHERPLMIIFKKMCQVGLRNCGLSRNDKAYDLF
jgi:hypothetical protein